MPQPAFQIILLTPPGRGAIATIRVEGPGACDQVDSLFHAASAAGLADLPPDRLAFGRFRLAEDVYDEVIVRRAASDTVEIHCHGGPAVVERIMTALTADEAVDRLDRFPEEILAVDRDQVMDAVRTHLHPERIVLTAAGDFEG